MKAKILQRPGIISKIHPSISFRKYVRYGPGGSWHLWVFQTPLSKLALSSSSWMLQGVPRLDRISRCLPTPGTSGSTPAPFLSHLILATLSFWSSPKAHDCKCGWTGKLGTQPCGSAHSAPHWAKSKTKTEALWLTAKAYLLRVGLIKTGELNTGAPLLHSHY